MKIACIGTNCVDYYPLIKTIAAAGRGELLAVASTNVVDRSRERRCLSSQEVSGRLFVTPYSTKCSVLCLCCRSWLRRYVGWLKELVLDGRLDRCLIVIKVSLLVGRVCFVYL